jgi:hypothetical protein
MKMREKTDWRLMAKVRARYADGIKEGAREAAEVLANDIQEHFTIASDPAIDSGNMRSAVMVSDKGRDDAGRFSGDNKASFFMTANAQDGDAYHGRGNYGPALEEGWSGPQGSAPAHPFVQPAIDRVASVLPNIIERKIR